MLDFFHRRWKPGDAGSIGLRAAESYCARLLSVYNAMRAQGGAGLLSHVPEWAQELAVAPVVGREAPQFNEEILKEYPRLQAALANCTSYTPSKWLLEQELSARVSNHVWSNFRRTGELLATRRDSWSPAYGEDVYDVAAKEDLRGLALSGGGIRSATFSLGILQSLAAEGLLDRFDYLSSVSGGGYIHQWLAAWIRREPKGIASVERKMRPLPGEEALARAPEQINWLRRYSSYLTPQRGLFTADTWTMAAIWFRNTFLNQIVLFSFFFCCLLVLRAMTRPFLSTPPLAGLEIAASLIGAWAVFGCFFFGRALASQTNPPCKGGKAPAGAIGNTGVLFGIVAPGFLSAILLSLVCTGLGGNGDHAALGDLVERLFYGWGAWILTLLLLETYAGKSLDSARQNMALKRRWPASLVGLGIGFLVSAVVVTALTVGGVRQICRKGGHIAAAQSVADLINRHLPQRPPCPAGVVVKTPSAQECCVTAGSACAPLASPAAQNPITPAVLEALLLPLFFFGAQYLAIRLQLGILGEAYEDSRREWLARLGAWSAIVSTVWLVLGLIARIGPSLFYALFDRGFEKALLSMLIAVVTHAITLYAGSSSKTSGTPDPRRFFGYSLLDLVGMIGAPIAILMLLVIASGVVDLLANRLRPLVEGYLGDRLGSSGGSLALLGISLFLLLVFGRRVDVNDFSLHPFYRDRLARCYLGASSGRRVPDPFTGFDDHDEASRSSGMTLAELLPERFGGASCEGGRVYDGPMPIFCSTVNLTFGTDLAYQDRKGASFAFSPLYTGYHVSWSAERERNRTTFNGFVETAHYAYPPQLCRDSAGAPREMCCKRRTGVLLATVTAISGAALSPNQGYNSQPALAFLMTLFNVRLGWWIANTRKPFIWPSEFAKPTPRFGLKCLISELLGRSDDTSSYVCLSDGGQFDNMGLYELIRRRVRLIVVCDGEEDDETTFGGIGLAIAKARIDFGVDIHFPREEIEKLTPDSETKFSSAHFAVGTIQYPAPPGSKGGEHRYRGTILYLKTAFVGDEPLDLRHYKREHPDFPQEGTLNQWFTEPQFESYRRLGQLTGERACARLRELLKVAEEGDPVTG